MQLESTGKIFIKDIKHFKKKVLLILSNGEEMEITEDIVMDYYLFPNKELNKEDLNNIFKSVNMSKALNKAYRILSHGLYTEKEIYLKLVKSNYSQDIIRDVILKLKRLNYLNDDNYVNEYLYNASIKGYGPHKIKNELLKKGIDEKVVNNISFNEEEKMNQLENIVKKLDKKYRNYNYQKKCDNILRSLINLGYDFDDSKVAIAKFVTESEETNALALAKDLEKTYKNKSKKYSGRDLINEVKHSLMKKGYKYDKINEAVKELDVYED